MSVVAPGEPVVSLSPVRLDRVVDMEALYRLLRERTPEQSISHRAMPEWLEHVRFVNGRPYHAWYMVRLDEVAVGAGEIVGSIYLTKRREIGVSIFRAHQRKGYARRAVELLMKMHKGTEGFLANVSPRNAASIAFWESLEFEARQVTYAWPQHRS